MLPVSSSRYHAKAATLDAVPAKQAPEAAASLTGAGSVADEPRAVTCGDDAGEVCAAPDFSFEGPEKLLEIWFRAPESGDNGAANDGSGASGLHLIPRDVWVSILDEVHCTIISTVCSKELHAYLLSESSLFVWAHKLTLKTCGTTTLLRGVAKILVAAKSVGLSFVEGVFYSRSNYFFPDRQLSPHSSFREEALCLNKYFNRGNAYVVGKIDGNHLNFYSSNSSLRDIAQNQSKPDCTLELLMTDLGRSEANRFYAADDYTSAMATATSGIGSLFENMQIDAHVFSPYGYSANGVRGDEYFTIHVTPQPSCSFASFETNVDMSDYTDLIQRVLRIFKPGRFILTTIANGASMRSFSRKKGGFDTSAFSRPTIDPASPVTFAEGASSCPMSPTSGEFRYRQTDDIVYSFDVYNLVFSQFEGRMDFIEDFENVARDGPPPTLEQVVEQVAKDEKAASGRVSARGSRAPSVLEE